MNQAQDEVNEDYKPEIKPLSKKLEEYDTIILGTPVWWYTFAPAINTLLSKYNFNKKRIIPFITNGGWIGHTVKDIKEACPNSMVENEINIQFSKDILTTSEEILDEWIKTLK